MKPEFKPGLRMRKGGSREIDESINAAMRRFIDPTKMTIVKAGDFAKNPAK